MSKPKISFVMPVRNCAAYLAQTFTSLLQQNLKDIEIIALNDCSTDSSLDILKHYEKNKKIKVIDSKEQRGAAWLRNLGNAMAGADIICVTDAGDLYHYARAKTTYKYFQKNPNIDIFSTGVEVIDSVDRHLKYEFPRLLDIGYGKKPSISHPTVAYRKRVIEKIKYRELTVHSDLYEAFLLEAVRAGFKHGFINQVYVKKRYTPELSGFRNLIEAWKYKKEVYIEFGIPLPKFLKGKVTLDRITKRKNGKYKLGSRHANIQK